MEDAMIGMVVDRSRSMMSMWSEAVGGINTFKNEQAANEGRAWITLNYFDNEQGQKYLAWDARDIPDLSSEDDEIFPRGMTALNDAIIRTIKDVDMWLEDNPWFDGQVFVVVVTDGMENASEARASAVKELVTAREAKGWTFVYLAANVDLDATAATYGFMQANSMAYDDKSVGMAYATASSAVTRSRYAGEKGDLLTEDERDVRQGSRS
jgi:Mg-chelatase subunit ChlD